MDNVNQLQNGDSSSQTPRRPPQNTNNLDSTLGTEQPLLPTPRRSARKSIKVIPGEIEIPRRIRKKSRKGKKNKKTNIKNEKLNTSFEINVQKTNHTQLNGMNTGVSSNLDNELIPFDNVESPIIIQNESFLIESQSIDSGNDCETFTPINDEKIYVSTSPVDLITPISVRCIQNEEYNSNEKKVFKRIHTTPYKRLQDNNHSHIELYTEDELSVGVSKAIVYPLMDNKKRKRSSSASEKPKKANRVTFYSPANSTLPIADIDELMRTSRKNQNISNITNRRMRSLSVTETETDKLLASVIHKEAEKVVEKTPDKPHMALAPISRTKMPNFAAIHKSFFDKMESITDHVNRKNERAKILSATKLKSGSYKKTVIQKSLKSEKTQLSVPKARQKIDLGIIPMNSNESTGNVKKFNTTASEIPVFIKSYQRKTNRIDTKKMDSTPIPDFSKISSKIDTNLISFKPSKEATPRKPRDFSNREKDRMNMYKTRVTRKKTDISDNKREIIRGVRSNRRFELQMMCRNRVNK